MTAQTDDANSPGSLNHLPMRDTQPYSEADLRRGFEILNEIRRRAHWTDEALLAVYIAKIIAAERNAAALSRPLPSGEGWKWVPVKPTEEMVKAGIDVQRARKLGTSYGLTYARETYQAMLAAASPSPAGVEGEEGASTSMSGDHLPYYHTGDSSPSEEEIARAFCKGTGRCLPSLCCANRCEAPLANLEILGVLKGVRAVLSAIGRKQDA